MFKKFLQNILGNDDNEPANTPAHPQSTITTPIQPAPPATSYDPETLHGTHYNVSDFDAEVERRVNAWVNKETNDGETFSQGDINSLYHNYRRDLYMEWNDADTDQYVRWSHANSMKHSGIATSGFVKEASGNPLLEPIHGISLRDYAAIAIKMSQGVAPASIYKVSHRASTYCL